MKQKIEWYKEVLELEPGSKIFFPLAQMLAKDGQPEEAIQILRQGIARHSDHVEARFLLVELLFKHGDKQELWREVDSVSSLLGGYPGFWQAWGERLGADPATRDAGLAVIFLAAYIRNDSLSWADIIATGLKGLLEDDAPSTDRAHTAAQEAGANAPVPTPALPAEAIAEESQPEEVMAEELSSGDAAPEAAAQPVDMSLEPSSEAPLDTGGMTASAPLREAAASITAAEETPADEEESEEPFSLRTRSMAEVLAEQGDMPGALEIYQELFEAASGEAEKTALSSRMAELKQRLESGAPGEEKSTEEAKNAPAKNRLSDMLEALAQRLEARSLQ